VTPYGVSLAVLKNAIEQVPSKPGRAAMLLAWSACLAKLSRTFLSAEGRAESRGGSSIFSIYRYKVAKKPIELSPWSTFEERAMSVIAAKSDKIYGEHLFNQIVVAAWRHGAIGSLDISKTEFIDLIQRNGWQYDERNHVWRRYRRSANLSRVTQ
jgi:hypothetical protein